MKMSISAFVGPAFVSMRGVPKFFETAKFNGMFDIRDDLVDSFYVQVKKGV